MWLSSWKIAGIQAAVNLLRRLAIAGLVVSLLTILMYLPSILFSGPRAIVSNRWVLPLPWSRFAQIAPSECPLSGGGGRKGYLPRLVGFALQPLRSRSLFIGASHAILFHSSFLF
jgi:hypothetical protein